jgi:hypothetical protein
MRSCAASCNSLKAARIGDYDNARFRWLGKPNLEPKGTWRWTRAETARKLSGKTVRELIVGLSGLTVRQRTGAPKSLARERLIEIEGYQGRATGSEMEERRDRLLEIVEASQPMTVRQVFYQATVHGIVEKEETGYDKIQLTLAAMRREEVLPFEWIVDNTRWEQRPYTYTDVADALQDTARTYRKTLWTDKDVCVQIWLEKDALSGVLEPITNKYDVALMVARGYSSITFLKDGAEKLPVDRPSYIYHLGDFDPSGVHAGEKIEEDLNEFAPDADIEFKRLAVTPEQIERWHLPSRLTKMQDSRAARFGSLVSVELDAIEPGQLRSLVEKAILKHLPKKKYEALKQQEQREKERIQELEMELQIDDESDEE